MYTFIAGFTSFLEQTGVPFTRRLGDDFDVLFVNSWAVPFDAVREVKRERPSVRVVQRVDGAAIDYGRLDDADAKQARVNLLADLTIFQSVYSRHSVREKYRVIAQDGPVILNPVDVTSFTPEGSRRIFDGPGPRVITVCWSTNRLKGTWQIDRYAAENPDVTFVLAGRFEHIGVHANVQRLGHLGRADLALALRSCDAFLNLSENDPCPNVIVEALASGLPVVYRNSGGVPELVGECGVALDGSGFRRALDEVMARRSDLSRLARRRAESTFASSLIFPQYLAAIEAAPLRPSITDARIEELADCGYPVKRRPVERARRLARAALDRSPIVRSVIDVWRRGRDAGPAKPVRIGWITHDSFPQRKRRLDELEPFTRMRTGRIAEWINANSESLDNELYRPGERYDVVVFQKMMDARCRAEAEAIRSSGGAVVFDANVNYYEIFGDYFISGTKPTDQQHADAVWMTRFADHVVADSTYLEGVIRTLNQNVTWIPDNVFLDVYAGERVHARRTPVRLIWSGVSKKAAHLLEVGDVLAGLKDVELVVVTDRRPDCVAELETKTRVRVVTPFSDTSYARELLASDIIISPRRLCNAYELAHTEYKIALGMGVGLPAVASPQQSYVEIISAKGGGIVAGSAAEWASALQTLIGSVERRAEIGARARQTVLERYSTGVVALRYLEVLERLAIRRVAAR
jgi:glycosyltransferase involved in cell wall biosynthesis